ncbi:MAG TPA: signal peptidase I [Patescibacteria group bacterium]|nr:signal peptidase I [Patescibacteria group bacterium]
MLILKRIYLFLIDTIQSLLVAAAIFLIIYIFLVRPFQVNGESMHPNFENGEYVLTDLIILHFQKLRLGDVIVFKAPPNPEEDFIKRVIGVPGDTVMVKDGNVYLNGKMVDQSSFLKPDVKTFGGTFLREGDTITVPQDEYFVMGDNRPYSSDSRDWGFVKSDEVIGESMLIYWPIQDMKWITNPFK